MQKKKTNSSNRNIQEAIIFGDEKFQGHLKKMHIVSNRICLTSERQLDKEVEQRLTVNDEGYKSYYYLTEDDSIDIGDFLIVPVGKENHEKVVQVVDIEYFNEAEVPIPVRNIKRIIRKY